MKIPRAYLRHTIGVERYLGSSATGPVYAPARELPCYVEALTRSVRTAEGRTVTSGDKVILDLDATLAPEDRVTVRGRVVEVVLVNHYESRLGAPDHTELVVQ